MGILSLTLIALAAGQVVLAENEGVAGIPETNREARQDEYGALVSQLSQQQREIDQLKAQISTLQTQQATVSNHRVAFNAHLTKPVSPASNQLIVFDDVRLNVGQAYHHGTFIAPYTGTYLFSVKLCSQGGHYVIADLLKNGNLIGQVLAGDDAYGDCSSETTVTELSAGDDVIVKHRGTLGDYIHGNSDYHNSFTGVFLY